MEAETGLPVVAASGGVIEAPGMMKSHYAPRAMMQLNVTECPRGAALLAFGDGTGKDRTGAAESLNLSKNGDLREAAANLYHHMKALDAGGTSLIAVEPVTPEGLGHAINDRLARAAAMEDRHA
jgi:L-threonylcarbamoyladenylate synthase